jgi:SAM-dependent methyltransferase
MKEFWNERYSENGFAYGIKANDFLIENYHIFNPRSRILCLAEGEGRNAIFMAKHGFDVCAVDQSEIGINKLNKWATEENIKIESVVADLNEYGLGENKWDGIISIFGHLPPILRAKVHHEIIKSLKVGGLFLCEGYTIEQLKFGTGGPKDSQLFLSKEILQEELKELKLIKLEAKERIISEGKYHQGNSAVVQFIGQKVGDSVQ